MKKLFGRKSAAAIAQDEPDLMSMISKIQQQLVAVEKKLDVLTSKCSQGPSDIRESSHSFQRFNRPDHRHDKDRRDNGFRGRNFTKVICADCNKECEVPFKPSADRPVYCRECFAKRKGAGSFHEKQDNRPREGNPRQEHHPYREHSAKRHRAAGKKKSAPRKGKS